MSNSWTSGQNVVVGLIRLAKTYLVIRYPWWSLPGHRPLVVYYSSAIHTFLLLDKKTLISSVSFRWIEINNVKPFWLKNSLLETFNVIFLSWCKIIVKRLSWFDFFLFFKCCIFNVFGLYIFLFMMSVHFVDKILVK